MSLVWKIMETSQCVFLYDHYQIETNKFWQQITEAGSAIFLQVTPRPQDWRQQNFALQLSSEGQAKIYSSETEIDIGKRSLLLFKGKLQRTLFTVEPRMKLLN
jgi:hypothetical protein